MFLLRLGREDAEMGQFVHVMCRTELSLGKQMLEVSDYTNSKANDTSHLFLKTHQSQFYTLIFILLSMWPGRVDAIQEVPSCSHFTPIWKAPGQLRLDAHTTRLALSPIFSILFFNSSTLLFLPSPLPHYCFFSLMKRDRAAKALMGGWLI